MLQHIVNLGWVLTALFAVHQLWRTTQRLKMQQTSLATSATWPPAYAVNKGVKQDLGINGFAYTRGNGCAFVHMKPVLHFGIGCERKALLELQQRLMTALHLTNMRIEKTNVEMDLQVAAVLHQSTQVALRAHDVDNGLGLVTPAAAAAAADELQCDRIDPSTGNRCIEDFEHEGECCFPEVKISSTGAKS
jgi:hypothetical protein